MCVLETDSEIDVEKISLANDSVTKSLDLICLAMFHTRLLRIRSHLLCNVNLCLVIDTEKLSSVRESSVQLSKESVRGTS